MSAGRTGRSDSHVQFASSYTPREAAPMVVFSPRVTAPKHFPAEGVPCWPWPMCLGGRGSGRGCGARMRRAQNRLPLKPRGDYAHVTRCAWPRATEESEMAQAHCVKDKKKVQRRIRDHATHDVWFEVG